MGRRIGSAFVAAAIAVVPLTGEGTYIEPGRVPGRERDAASGDDPMRPRR